VAEDDLVHFVIQAVERLPRTTFALNHKGCGDEQHWPHTLLALLICCYANGVFSSRRLERAAYRDVAVRCLTADTHPDHDTICAFRRNRRAAIAAAFVDVVELARELQLLSLGMVSLDGTHLKANASKDKNVTCQRAQELRPRLRRDVNELLHQAERTDQQDQDPQQLPKEIARREKLLQKMDQACARLEARAQARAAAQRAEYERKVAARQERGGSGPHPKLPSAAPAPDEQINLTGPAARLMRKNKREGSTQSYNAQAVVDTGSRLIVGRCLSGCPSDAGQLEPDLQSIPAGLGQPSAALADGGFVDRKVFARLGRQSPALALYVSVHSEDAPAERRYDYRPPDKLKPPKKITDPALLAMADKLKAPAGKKIYRQRASTVEPVFGIIKAALGFRQFLLRGIKKVTGEWNLICLAYNFKRRHRWGAGLKLAGAG
jgi:transposase